MFGIGLTELIIIAVIALLVVGPDQLPAMAQKLGRFVWDIRRAWDDVRDTVRSEMMIVKQPFDEFRQAGQAARDSVTKGITEIKTETASIVNGQSSIAEPKPQTANGEPQTPPPATDDRRPATPETESTVTPQAYKPRPAAGPAIQYFDLDGNPVPAPEKR